MPSKKYIGLRWNNRQSVCRLSSQKITSSIAYGSEKVIVLQACGATANVKTPGDSIYSVYKQV